MSGGGKCKKNDSMESETSTTDAQLLFIIAFFHSVTAMSPHVTLGGGTRMRVILLRAGTFYEST